MVENIDVSKYRLDKKEYRALTDGLMPDVNDAAAVLDAQSAKAIRLATTELQAENAALYEKLGDLSDIVGHIEIWANAYPESVPFFAPLSKTEVQACVKAMIEHSGIDAPSDRMHAQWGRIILDSIRDDLTKARALLTGDASKKEAK